MRCTSSNGSFRPFFSCSRKRLIVVWITLPNLSIARGPLGNGGKDCWRSLARGENFLARRIRWFLIFGFWWFRLGRDLQHVAAFDRRIHHDGFDEDRNFAALLTHRGHRQAVVG